MTIEVTGDIVEGSSYKKTANGLEFVRKIGVSGITTGSAWARMQLAVEYSGAVEGERFRPEPGMPMSICKSVGAEPQDSNDTFLVTATYGPTDMASEDEPELEAQVAVTTSTAQETTNRDWEGKFVVLEHPGQAVTKQTGTMSVLVPRTSISIKRLESDSPLERSKEFTGKVNAENWTVDGSAPARTWLCSAISGNSNDGGATFEVTYDFLYRPNTSIWYDGEENPTAVAGWDQVITFTDPETGKIPDDVIDEDTGKILIATAVQVVQVYEVINFNELDL